METIVICAYNRPEYFKKALKSLVSGKIPVYFFLDGGEGATQDENVKIIETSEIENYQIIRRSKNLGCGNNLIEARKTIFDQLGFESALILEDDLVLSPYFVPFMSNFLKWSGDALITSNGKCKESVDWKKEHLHMIKKSQFSQLWGYGLTKKIWNTIKSDLYYYQENFLIGSYKQRPHGKIQAWLKQLSPSIFKENCATGQDAATIYALNKAKIPIYVSIVNRIKNIGAVGEHFLPEHYLRHKLHEVNLDIFPEDQNIKEFYYAK